MTILRALRGDFITYAVGYVLALASTGAAFAVVHFHMASLAAGFAIILGLGFRADHRAYALLSPYESAALSSIGSNTRAVLNSDYRPDGRRNARYPVQSANANDVDPEFCP